MKKDYWLLSMVLIIVTLISGCAKNNSDPLSEEHAVVKIGFMSEERFESRYGNTIKQKYPNLTYTIVPTADLTKGAIDVETWAKENSADVIFVPRQYIEEFISSGLILNLDALIKKSSFNLEAFHPRVVEYARKLGNGSIYGIPPTMSGSLIAYNKSLFDEHHVDYPRDQMTWEQLLELAQQFPGQGLSAEWSSAADLAWHMGAGSGLKGFEGDPPSNVVIKGEAWEKVWQTAAEAAKSGAVVFEEPNKRSFFEGTTPMSIIPSYRFKMMEANLNIRKTFEAGLVTMPVNPNDPESTGYVWAEGFYAISSSASSLESAFDLLQFLLSPPISRWESISTLEMPTLITEKKSKYADVLYRLTPVELEYPPFPFVELGAATIEDMIENETPAGEALQRLQVKLEQVLKAENESLK